MSDDILRIFAALLIYVAMLGLVIAFAVRWSRRRDSSVGQAPRVRPKGARFYGLFTRRRP